MVKHIVMWKLKAFAEGKSREENILVLKEKLERLKTVIPEIRHLELGVNFNSLDYASDVVLYSEFKNRKISNCIRIIRNIGKSRNLLARSVRKDKSSIMNIEKFLKEGD